jgi:dolichyl-phosphate-mannose--protein O-mannosyl transferase
MLQDISYFYILGIPFIVYLGIITIGFFLITALLAILKRKNMINMSVQWHYHLAFLSIVLGIFHSILGVLIYI